MFTTSNWKDFSNHCVKWYMQTQHFSEEQVLQKDIFPLFIIQKISPMLNINAHSFLYYSILHKCCQQINKTKMCLRTIFFVDKGSLRRFWDTFPNCYWFRIARVHGSHFFTVPPVPVIFFFFFKNGKKKIFIAQQIINTVYSMHSFLLLTHTISSSHKQEYLSSFL